MVTKKKSTKKNSEKETNKSSKIRTEKSMSKKEWEMNKTLIQNSVSLQKVVVDLSSKFEKLSTQISSLLNLFEKSAKSFAEKQDLTQKDKEFVSKIDKLIEQNKIIAHGLTLMEEKIKKEPEKNELEAHIPKPLPEI